MKSIHVLSIASLTLSMFAVESYAQQLGSTDKSMRTVIVATDIGSFDRPSTAIMRVTRIAYTKDPTYSPHVPYEIQFQVEKTISGTALSQTKFIFHNDPLYPGSHLQAPLNCSLGDRYICAVDEDPMNAPYRICKLDPYYPEANAEIIRYLQKEWLLPSDKEIVKEAEQALEFANSPEKRHCSLALLRNWSTSTNSDLKTRALPMFDRAMLKLFAKPDWTDLMTNHWLTQLCLNTRDPFKGISKERLDLTKQKFGYLSDPGVPRELRFKLASAFVSYMHTRKISEFGDELEWTCFTDVEAAVSKLAMECQAEDHPNRILYEKFMSIFDATHVNNQKIPVVYDKLIK